MNNSTVIETTNGTGCAGYCRGATIFTPEIFLIYNMYLSISLVLGITGNGLVLAVFAKYKTSTSTDWFIIFITIFDFISSIFNVPIYLTFTTGHWQTIGNDIFCKVHMFVSQSVVLSSTFLICGLAIERYLKVCQRNSLKISKRWAFRICVIITCITTLLSIPCFKMYTNDRGQCATSALIQWVFFYYLLVLLTYVFAFVVVTVSYTNITLMVLRSERNLARHSSMTQSQHNALYRCCCCRVSVKNNNRVAPSSLVTNTLSLDTHAGNGISATQSHSNRAANTKRAQNLLTIPSVSKGTNTSTGSDYCDPSNVGMPALGQRPSLRTDKTAHSSRESAMSVSNSRKIQGKRTTRITFAVCLIFIISWIPPWVAFVLFCIPSMHTQPAALRFGLFGKMTYLLNTFMNPILYFILNRKFREQTACFLCFWK